MTPDAAHVALFQLIASSFLTLASLTIAGTAMAIAYRQHFGWKPLVLIGAVSSTWGDANIGRDDSVRKIKFVIDFEVWNRRKYPIVIHSIIARFDSLTVAQFESPRRERDGWEVYAPRELVHTKRLSLDSNTHQTFRIEGASKEAADLTYRDTFEISVEYFDPIKAEFRVVRISDSYEPRIENLTVEVPGEEVPPAPRSPSRMDAAASRSCTTLQPSS